MIAILILLVILFVSAEAANLICYGKYLSEKECEEYLNLDLSAIRLNTYDSSILYLSPTLSNFTFPIIFQFFGKYYIYGVGIVPRWSKLHKRIKEYYQIAKNNK